MADFNAYPALDIRVPQMQPGPDLGNILEQANKIQAGRNENSLFPLKQQEEQNKLSLFPQQQEAAQTENAYNKLILGEAQQAQKYNNINRQLKGIAAQFKDDPKGAEKAWNTMMADPAFPEGKQWGEISANKLDTALKTYGQQEQTSTNRVRAATAVSQQQQQSGGNALSGGVGSGYSASQNSAFGQMNPQQTQGQVAAFNKMSDWLDKIGDSKDTAGEWNKELDNPNFRKVFGSDKFSWDRYKAIKDQVDSRKEAMAGLGVNAAQGLQNPRDPQKFQQSGDSIFVEHPYDYEHPLKEVGRGASKPNWQLDTYTEKNGETYPVYHDTTSGKQRIGDFPAVGGKYDTKGANAMSPEDRENAAQEIYHNVRKISDFAKTEAGGLNTRVKQLEESGAPAFGTTGKAGIDMSVPGYATKPVPGAGGLTQATIDEGSAYYASGLGFPAALGLGSAGPTGAQKQAIMNRSSERFPGVDLASNKAQAAAMIAATKKQVDVATTTERSLNNFDATFQDLVDKFKGKVNLYDVPLANLMANPAKYQIDPEDVAPFRASLNEVQREYNQINTRGGQLTDLVRKTTGDILPNNLSFNTMQKVHDALSSQGRIILKGDYDEVNKVSKMFTTSRGGTPLTPGGGSDLPAEAKAQLQEGKKTTFGNGQTWMLKNGQPVQVQK